MSLTLKPEPDEFGFLYGTALTPSGDTVVVNIMPPIPHWRGRLKLQRTAPHATDWVIYADGEEIGRVRHLEHVQPVVERYTRRFGVVAVVTPATELRTSTQAAFEAMVRNDQEQGLYDHLLPRDDASR